jgi:hypothetical protein
MHPIEYNLELGKAILEEIEPFLLSEEIFWPLNHHSKRGMPYFPRLTLGTLLLTLDQLSVQFAAMSSSQKRAQQEIQSMLERVQLKWPAALERKAVRESQTRFNLWRAYLSDLEERKDTTGNYHNEVRNRVIHQRLQEFHRQTPHSQDGQSAMDGLDFYLRSSFKPGPFLWNEALIAVYPSPSFWYLYGRPARISGEL